MNKDIHWFVRDLMDLFDCNFTKAVNDIINYKWPIPLDYRIVRNGSIENRKETIKAWCTDRVIESKYGNQIQMNELILRRDNAVELLDNLNMDLNEESAESYINAILEYTSLIEAITEGCGLTEKIRPIHILDKVLFEKK